MSQGFCLKLQSEALSDIQVDCDVILRLTQLGPLLGSSAAHVTATGTSTFRLDSSGTDVFLQNISDGRLNCCWVEAPQELRGLSPRVTDACRRSQCQRFAHKGLSARRIPTAVFSVFYTEAATFSSKQLLNCTHENEWAPFQTHYLSENVVPPGLEPLKTP
jgi:hypothetical protein